MTPTKMTLRELAQKYVVPGQPRMIIFKRGRGRKTFGLINETNYGPATKDGDGRWTISTGNITLREDERDEIVEIVRVPRLGS